MGSPKLLCTIMNEHERERERERERENYIYGKVEKEKNNAVKLIDTCNLLFMLMQNIIRDWLVLLKFKLKITIAYIRLQVKFLHEWKSWYGSNYSRYNFTCKQYIYVKFIELYFVLFSSEFMCMYMYIN